MLDPTLQPQHLFAPRYLIMGLEEAARLTEMSVEGLKDLIKSGQAPQFELIETPEGVSVEYKAQG